ncbi:hypothetical protein BDN72DRAFT_857133 [Pluteus cervinus]|uniref:Uncharacterized protein n=1 Tax=Pluteus cervinus TaxID=181527 RepID=A0ACD3AXV7_9AGAR|nr:hypothetical protein BDN72DRAFT_857133 [Pluteus cervinus]
MQLPLLPWPRKIPGKRDTLPAWTTFVLFTVDPVATVKHLRDPDASAAARKMKPRTYLAYVNKVYDLILLAHRPPERDALSGIEPDMCTPVAPTIFHPSGREPLQPSKPLPFENCYLHSIIPVKKVKAKTVWRRYDNAITMTGQERCRDKRLAGQDKNRMRRLRHQYALDQDVLARSSESTAPGPPDPENYKVVEVLYRGALQKQLMRVTPANQEEQGVTEGPSDKGSDKEGSFELQSVAPLVFALGTPDESMIAITNISYNLSTVKDFEEPAEFFAEEAYLQQIIQESKERTAARVRKIDDEAYGAGTAQNVISNSNRRKAKPEGNWAVGDRAVSALKSFKKVLRIRSGWKGATSRRPNSTDIPTCAPSVPA